MKRLTITPLAFVLLTASSLAAHDLFLKPFAYFVAPGAIARVRVLNGTFTKSENSVAKDRIADLSVVSPRGVEHPSVNDAWADAGDTSVFTFSTSAPGTYIVGASTMPRGIKLDGKRFNGYLASDGVPDVLDAQRRSGELEKPSHERYSKHVKTVLQVGEDRTGGFDAALG